MREQIIKELKEYFCIEELVDREVYALFGDVAWRFFQTDILHTLLVFRKNLGLSMIVNTWKWKGNLSQRGLRHNQSDMVRTKKGIYLSAHMRGGAVDFNVKGMDSEEVREWAVKNAHLFPCKIRLERNIGNKPISWVHVDTDYEEKNPKVYLFDI